MKWGLVSFVVFGAGFWLGSTQLQAKSEIQSREKSRSRAPAQEHTQAQQNLPAPTMAYSNSIGLLSDPKVWPLERLRHEKRKQDAAFEKQIFTPSLVESAYTTTNRDAAKKIVDGWQLTIEREANRLYEKTVILRGLFSYTHKDQVISGTLLWIPHCDEYGCHFERKLMLPGETEVHSYRSSNADILAVKDNQLLDEFRLEGELSSFGLTYFYAVPIHQESRKFWMYTSEMNVVQGEVSWQELSP